MLKEVVLKTRSPIYYMAVLCWNIWSCCI